MNAAKKLVLLSFCLLTACAPPRPAAEAPVNETMPVKEREEKTATVSSWVINGAMAAKNQNKSWTASVNWKQQGAGQYQIRLFGPLGGGTVIIEKNGGVITYKDGPKTVTSNSADKLLAQETGIKLPVSNLYYWVRGLPAPGPVQVTEYDRYNHLKTLKQSGYTVKYLNYTSKGNVDLPSKIQLTGHGLSMKLVIKSWSV
ncbi:lipoprotein insertase outer membrane protein LolB [Legionella impletisoli]|uniref:Outer-membrane lipoprotein LolB n=1 Tax=Legionella impletisoli TaxID=343510 RepID=A0A917JXI7_9GAMM|nr:lipoprotein insertase outer membrane protein LolB [Legionella impletisoli]GGI88848.1 outer-membrane lipoprotein LolB [Legionella impletisoli]